MKMRIAGIVNDSIVDGPGLRLAVFAQGCPHNCPGCHNPESHDYAGGQEMDTEDIIARMDANPLLDGITLTGGEPFEQPEPCRLLAEAARARGLNVWAYSGYTFEQLCAMPEKMRLLEACDILVDGPFLLEERSLDLRFRGSKNQRILSVADLLKEPPASA